MLLDERRAAEGEAMFHQFSDQIRDLVTYEAANLFSIVAEERFGYLPPVGMIPLGGLGSAVGFDQLKFFKESTTRPVVFIPGALVEDLIRESFGFPPIRLDSPELIWLYLVRENMEAFDQSPVLNSPQPYLIFSNGQMPFRGVPRFDLADWSYSNFV
jgi:hypothetical protein